MVVRFTIKEIDGSSGNPGDRRKKTVIHTLLESPSVKGIKIRVERCVALSRKISNDVTGNTRDQEDSVLEEDNLHTGIDDLRQREVCDGRKRDKDASQRNLVCDP